MGEPAKVTSPEKFLRVLEKQASMVKTARTELVHSDNTLESAYAQAIEKHRRRENNEINFESDAETAQNQRVDSVINKESAADLESPDMQRKVYNLRDKMISLNKRANLKVNRSASPN